MSNETIGAHPKDSEKVQANIMSAETLHYVILPLIARIAVSTLLVVNAVIWAAVGVS